MINVEADSPHIVIDGGGEVERQRRVNLSCPVILRNPSNKDLRRLVAADMRLHTWFGLSGDGGIQINDILAANGVGSLDELRGREYVLLPEVVSPPRIAGRTTCTGGYYGNLSNVLRDEGYLAKIVDSKVFVGLGKDGSGFDFDVRDFRGSGAVVVEFDELTGKPKGFSSGVFLGLVGSNYDDMQGVIKDGDVFTVAPAANVFLDINAAGQ